mgnify:CR=1 FL=1
MVDKYVKGSAKKDASGKKRSDFGTNSASDTAARTKKYQDDLAAKQKQKKESDAASIANSKSSKAAAPLYNAEHRTGKEAADENDRKTKEITSSGFPTSMSMNPEVVDAIVAGKTMTDLKAEKKKKATTYAENE